MSSGQSEIEDKKARSILFLPLLCMVTEGMVNVRGTQISKGCPGIKPEVELSGDSHQSSYHLTFDLGL